MIIENEIKLDFNDVLIKPKRSNLNSRSEVELLREFKFKHVNDYTWKGIPIMISNMDTTGTFEMAIEGSKFNIMTCIHKYYTLAEWQLFIQSVTVFENNDNIFNHIAISCGSKDSDLIRLDEILTKIPQLKFICLDVANGYTQSFVEVVSQVRQKYQNKVIIAGTVVTREMTEELLIKGADIIKE